MKQYYRGNIVNLETESFIEKTKRKHPILISLNSVFCMQLFQFFFFFKRQILPLAPYY